MPTKAEDIFTQHKIEEIKSLQRQNRYSTATRISTPPTGPDALGKRERRDNPAGRRPWTIWHWSRTAVSAKCLLFPDGERCPLLLAHPPPRSPITTRLFLLLTPYRRFPHHRDTIEKKKEDLRQLVG